VESSTWWTLVPSTVGGLIGGGFAVLGMWITGRRERSRIREAHEREALLAARQVLLSIEDLYASDRADDAPWELNPTGTQKQQRLLRELATHAASVADVETRELLELSTRVIGSAIVFQTQGDRYGQIAYQMCTHGRSVITARLRGERAPAEPGVIGEYRAAIAEAEEGRRRYWEEQAQTQTP
jgi:hypothetical protein